jgi:DNA modification methylase
MSVIDQHHTEDFSLYNGDCVEVTATLPDDSVDMMVYSPPFSNLYIYSDSERDMGNCKDDAEFSAHYSHLLKDLFRVLKPGRICAVHCKQLVDYANSAGHAGWRDFRGDIIRAHQAAGFVYHCEIVIDKCPVTEMTRTKCQRLLYKQLRDDSTFSGVGMPEYLVIFRKWPINRDQHVKVGHTPEEFPLYQWQEWAKPVWRVWYDIQQTNVLNAKVARSDADEKHICPLQLDVIERAVTMWSNPGEVVFTPFLGIGSEAFQSLKMGRRAVGVELKPEYFAQAISNCNDAISARHESDMFGGGV